MPWYWEYPEDYITPVDRRRAMPRLSFRQASKKTLRTSYWANTVYYHCPHCPRAWYDQDAARSCCTDVIRERRYIARQQEMHRMRFTITLDTVAI